SPDGQTLASAGADGQVVLWDLTSRKLIGKLAEPKLQPTSLAFGAGGKALFVGYTNGSIRVWNTISRSPGASFAFRGYTFGIAPLGQSKEQPGRRMMTFDNAQAEGGKALLFIERDGVLLKDRVEQLGHGPLHLVASRQGGWLSFQVNDLKPLSVLDIFPLPL